MTHIDPLGYEDTELDTTLLSRLATLETNCTGCSGLDDRQLCVKCPVELGKQNNMLAAQKVLNKQRKERQAV